MSPLPGGCPEDHMKLKLDDAGHVVVSDGKPVYLHDDGKEAPIDAAHTLATIARLNSEAKGHREAKEAAETKLREYDGLENALYTEKVGGAFSRSKYITDKIAVPSDMVQAMFGSRFKVENGKIIGVGLDNQPIYSRSKAGEIADFDEALESMVDAYPSRDTILKGTGNQGDGARHPNGAPGGGKDLSGLSPAARISATREASAQR